ncbi:ribbon-helix-helix domain-containing protein [Streptomyces sp. NPDC001156]
MTDSKNPIRTTVSFSSETERRLREASQKSGLSMALLMRQGIEARVAQVIGEEPEIAIRTTAHDLMEAREQFGLLLDAVDGVRADMEKRGWSSETAQGVAMVWFLSAMGLNGQ